MRIGGWTPRANARSSSDRGLEFGVDLVQVRLERRGVGSAAIAGEPKCEPQAEQCLLCAVVQVALDPAALGVGRRDDPRARLTHLEQPRADLRLQA